MPSYVVAGASRGIGAAFVAHLSRTPGNTVFAIARNPDTAPDLQRLKARANVHLVKGDLTDAASLKAAADAVAKVTGGTLDVLINNGAVLGNGWTAIDEFPTPEDLIRDFRSTFDTNVIGVILSTNAFLPLLRKGDLKKVLTLSSAVGDAATVLETEHLYSPAYSVSKAALEMVGAKYAVKYKDEGFTFLTICPGMVKTEMSAAPEAPEDQPKVQRSMAGFAKIIPPNWKGPLEPAESVDAMLAVLERTTLADSGMFVSHHGNRSWL